MQRQEIKKLLDQEIKKVCDKKAIDFTSLNLEDDLNLLASGIFDSFGILQLISSLEENLNVDVDLSDYSPKDFTKYGCIIDIFEKANRHTVD